MPTVMREGGFRIAINFDDHFPPHVHVYKSGAVLRINLLTGWVMTKKGKISGYEMRKAERLIQRHTIALLEIWEKYHA